MYDMTIPLSDDVKSELEEAAKKRNLSLEELAEAFLKEKLERPKDNVSEVSSASQGNTESNSIYDHIGKLKQEVQEQLRPWTAFLNNVVGILSFTLAVACLGTNTPGINAVLSFIFVFFVWRQGKKYFPPKIKELRELAKSNEHAKSLLKLVENESFSNRGTLKRYPIFFFGFFFLATVMLLPFFIPEIDATLLDVPSWLENYFKVSPSS